MAVAYPQVPEWVLWIFAIFVAVFVLPVSIVCFRYHLHREIVVPVTIQERLPSKVPHPVDPPRPCVTSWVLLTIPVLSITLPPPPVAVHSGAARITIRLRSGMRDSSFHAVQVGHAGARSGPRIQLVPESPMWPAVRTCGPRLCKAPWPHFSTSGVRTPSCK